MRQMRSSRSRVLTRHSAAAQEVDELLRGSALHSDALEICGAFEASREELQAVLAEPISTAALGGSAVTERQLRCALALAMLRAAK